ncbi:unnamed protein product [Caenorhabditis sp. 36 PRJEB53466]|nr:unnamed protein product [Caenorhabditis sp. 36 PRJEB53466]
MVEASVEGIEEKPGRSGLRTLLMAWLNEKEEDRFEKAPKFSDFIQISFKYCCSSYIYKNGDGVLANNDRFFGVYRRSYMGTNDYAYRGTRDRQESRRLLLKWFDRNCDMFEESKATDGYILIEFVNVSQCSLSNFVKNFERDSNCRFIPMELREEDTNESVLIGWIRVQKDNIWPVNNDRVGLLAGGDELAFIVRAKKNEKNSKLFKDFFATDLIEFMRKPLSDRIQLVKSFANEHQIDSKAISCSTKLNSRLIILFFKGLPQPETSDRNLEMKIAVWYLTFKNRPELLDDCRFEGMYRALSSKKKKDLEAHFNFEKPTKHQIEEFAATTTHSVELLTRFYDRIERNRAVMKASAIAAGHQFDAESDRDSVTASPKRKIARR